VTDPKTVVDAVAAIERTTRELREVITHESWCGFVEACAGAIRAQEKSDQ
jgi:hypothetical protein